LKKPSIFLGEEEKEKGKQKEVKNRAAKKTRKLEEKTQPRTMAVKAMSVAAAMAEDSRHSRFNMWPIHHKNPPW